MKLTLRKLAMLGLVLAGCSASTGPEMLNGEMLSKETLADNYCHMRFRTVESSDPARPQEPGDIVDFYGPCDESPTSRDQLLKLQRDRYYRYQREYFSR